jgi:phenylalanyl-tRNA synthetase beta chain
MRLVLSWLREFVDLDASAEDVAHMLSLRGFEVASLEPLAGGDAVIDFEITANRPDCLGVIGLAREAATAFDRPMRLPSHDAAATIRLRALPTGQSDRLSVSLEDHDLCPRYAAAVAAVSVGPSPEWLAARLQAAGVRPISSVVDITNYVNLEIGQPMHAFDLDKLAGAQIRIRRARPGETITTLDGIDRELEPDMLVIADRDRAQAVAGVMGGAASEVSPSTTMIALESAYFKPTSVRWTSKRLGLKTEASSRFERGADIGAQVVAIERAAALLEQVGAGRAVGPVVDCYPAPRQPRRLHLRRERLARLLGASVPDGDVERILRRLGVDVTPSGDGWDVVAPTFRVDLVREVDLIEEVGRHYGFDRLEPTFPVVTAAAPPPDQRIPRDQLVRRVLTAAGLSEAVTFGFLEAATVSVFSSGAVGIANPLSAKFDTLRPTLLAGLVDAVAHNRRHGRRDVALFEIGTRFAADAETRGVGLAWTGTATSDHWSGTAREVDFFDIKGVVEVMSDALGVPIRLAPNAESFLAAGQSASIVVADGPGVDAIVGFAGRLAPSVAESRGLPVQDAVFVAELDLDALARARVTVSDATRPLPRYPSVVRDLSIVVPDILPAEIIRGTIQTAGRGTPAPLVAVSFFDRYLGAGIAAGRVSVSVRLTFQAPDRTLTDAEVQRSVDAILSALVNEHGAVQR